MPGLQVLPFTCCLIHIVIIILRNILYLVYLSLCLGVDLLMSDLWDLFFIFSLIFIVINHITSLKWTHLFFVHFLNISYCFRMIMWIKKASNFQIAKVQPPSVAELFAWVFANFGLALLIKLLLIKKACNLPFRLVWGSFLRPVT